MKVFTTAQVRELDKLTIEKEPVSSIHLMERASLRFTQWFTNKFDSSNPVAVFAGSGNNGGDALAVSRLLIEKQYKVKVYLVSSGASLSSDCAINLKKLKGYADPVQIDLNTKKDFPAINSDEIVIDGIFGSGLTRPVEGGTAEIIKHINEHSGKTVSIDIPSGLFGEGNQQKNTETIIKANYTVSFEFPFLSFFMGENEIFTGEWVVVPIGLHDDSVKKAETSHFMIDGGIIRDQIIPRKKFSHKGTYGHALIIAGRYGMMGAAVLCAKACIRGGAGLTTVCIPRAGFDVVQISIPEALIEHGKGDDVFSGPPDLDAFQAIGCGPAIGQSVTTASALYELITMAKVPLVLDADALNILSENKEWLGKLPEGSVLTPHPKEFDRLAGNSANMYSRHLKQLEFVKKYNVILVLKGAHTIVASPEGISLINNTGNPGMATGGTGDVLTGLLVSLIAQGYSSLNASVIAVYIHGLAADIALKTSSVEALTASDIIENFGNAFRMSLE